MVKFYKLLTLFVIVFTLFTSKVNASHVSGADITYKWLSGNQYEVTLNLYRDCSGITVSSTATVYFTSTCGGSTSLLVTLTNGTSGTEISQLCTTEIVNSTCNGGSLPGMQQYKFKGIITLPSQCDTWTMYWSECDRNTSINLSGIPCMYVESTLKSTSFQNNSSPIFTAQPVPYVCSGIPVNYNHGVVELDGDSLRFTLVGAKTSSGGAITYNAGYSALVPIPGITINNSTGQFSFTPPATIGNFVVVMLVEEYTSAGVLKGTTLRDIQFVVRACTNAPPLVTSGAITTFSSVGAVQVGTNSINMCEGNSFTFKASFSDPNATDVLTFTSNVTSALPGATITKTGTNPMVVTVSWTAPIGFPPQTTSFYVSAEDNACPVKGIQAYTYFIRVADQTTAGPDKKYCQGGVTTTLDGYGGTTFTWAKLGGGTTYLSCTNCQVPTLTGVLPIGTHTYTVTSNLLGCKNKDTVVVTSVASFTFTPTASPASVCKYGSSTLSAGVAAGVYTYTWTPSTYLSATNTASTVSTPMVSTTYSILATSSLGCSQSKNIAVTVSGVAPISTATAADNMLCAGQSTTLTATGFVPPVSCGVPGVACTAANVTYTLGTGTSTSSTASPYYGGWHDGRVQYIVTKAELNAMGFLGGVFETLAFKMGTKSSTANYTGFTIKMSCTSMTDFPSSSPTFQAGLTTVYGPANVNPTANSWNTYTLAGNGFAWDGDSNILVEVCFDNGAYTSSDAVEYTTTSNYMAIYDYADNDVGCNLSTPYSTTTRPNMQFGICSSSTGLTYSWSPATFLSATNISSPTVTAPAATTTYIVTVTSGACFSTKSVTVNVGANFNLTMSPDAQACYGSSAALSASPDIVDSYTYAWSPSNTLSASNIANPTATPVTTTTYIVTVTSIGGCDKIGSVTVNMKPGNLTVSASASAPIICKGTSTNLTSNATSAPSVCGTGTCTGAITTYTIGTGTGTSSGYGVSTFYGASTNTTRTSYKRQYLYTKAMLNAAGINTGCVIKSLAFKVTSSSGTIVDFIAKMGCTSLTALTSTYETGLLQVINARNVNYAVGWVTMALDNPYAWDGTSNIIVEICADPLQKITPATCEYTSATSGSVCYSNPTNTTGACSLGTGSTDNWLPNMQLGICIPSVSVTYAWTPATDLSNPAIANPIATPVLSTTYSVTATDAGTGCLDTKQVPITVNSIDAGPDISLCTSSSTTILATFSGSSAPSSCSVATSPCGSTTDYTIGTGTSTTSTSPFYGLWTKDQMQILYTKADLNAAGISGASTINKLAFKLGTKASTKAYQGFTISIGCTSLAALATFQTGLTTVYTNASFVPVTTSWNVFNFTGSGYIWDGNSNIIVNVCFDNGSSNYSSTDPVEYTTTAFNSVIYDNSDTGTDVGCAMPSPSTTTSRPNIIFSACSYSSVPTFTWTSTPTPRITGATNLSSITTTVLVAPVTYTVKAVTSGLVCTLTDVVVATVGSPNNLVWDGSTSTDWFTASNWDLDCVPACNSTVVVPNTAPNMPIIATASTANCNSIDINAGATLTMNGTAALSVCGDYLNNGTLTAAATSTMLFGNGSVVQNIDGANTGTNKFGNLTVTKTGGSVTLLEDIDIGGTFTTSNATSLCNTNGKYIRLTGHFLNNAGGSTFSNVTGTLEFTGTSVQTYSAGNDNLVLNNVLMNETGAGYVYLKNNMVVGTSGSVVLTNGKIVTNAKEVRVLNTANGAIGAGSANSYIEGNLRRLLAASGNYNFAVGHSTRGYERIRFNFTSTGGIDNLLVRFDPYGAVPAAPGWAECSANYNLPALDNGFWTADAYDNTFAALGPTALGTYTATLFNTSYTNNTGANGWTVMKAPSGTSAWALQGNCVISPITAVQRAAMNGFSKFATAQSSVPLPIKLLNFTGKTIGLQNHLEWNTSREDNSDYFILQRSKDGENFEQLTKVKAQGNSNMVVNYTDIDRDPYLTTYYRLMMVDKSGDTKFSEIVTLYMPNNNYNITIKPNPAFNTIFVDVYSSSATSAEIQIVDMMGRIVKNKNIELTEGNNSIENDLSEISKGVYFVRLTSNNTLLFNGKFIKQ